MVIQDTTNVTLGQAQQQASSARKSGASGSTFADVMVGQSEEPRSKADRPIGTDSSLKPDAAQSDESAAIKPETPEDSDVSGLEDELKDELEKAGTDANAYLMQLLMASQGQETAEVTETAQAENLDVLEGMAVQADGGAALAAQAEGEMARMPTDEIPMTDFAVQDVEAMPEEVAPSPLENAQKLMNAIDEAVNEKAAVAPEQRVQVTAEADSANDQQQSSQTDLSQQGAQAAIPAFTPDQQPAPQVQAAPQAAPQQLPQQLAQSAVTQTIEAIATGVQNGERTLTIQMRPEFLGRLQMQLVMNEDGLTAKIRTSDPAVQATIASEITKLQAELEEKGILIKEVEVLLASPEEQFFDQQRFASQQQFQQGAERSRTRYARFADFEAQITQLMPGDELNSLENINGSVSFTA